MKWNKDTQKGTGHLFIGIVFFFKVKSAHLSPVVKKYSMDYVTTNMFQSVSLSVTIKALPWFSPSSQEAKVGVAGDQKERCQDPLQAVQWEDLCPLPEATGKVLEFWRSVSRL